MREPVPQRGAVHARMPQVLDPLIGRDVGALGRLGVEQAVDVDRSSTRRGFDLERAHRAPVGAPAPRDARRDRPAATTASTCTSARQSGVCP